MKRYAIRTIAEPVQYLKDGRYAGWSESPGDARVFNRRCDAVNCPRFDPDDCEIIGVVAVTQSEWDLLNAATA